MLLLIHHEFASSGPGERFLALMGDDQKLDETIYTSTVLDKEIGAVGRANTECYRLTVSAYGFRSGRSKYHMVHCSY